MGKNSQNRRVSKKRGPRPVPTVWKRRAWFFVGVSLGSVLLVFYTYAFITKSVPAEFTSKMTQVGDIELAYHDPQSTKVSPLCGCKEIGEWENWRGITFSARNIAIERAGTLPVTGYLLFPAEPGPTRISPGLFRMRTTFYLIEIDQNSQFDPQALFSEKPSSGWRVVQKEDGDEGFIQILSEKGLNIALFGDKPLGAWIPMENSALKINYEFRNDIASPPPAVIRERYRASTKYELDQVWNELGWYDETRMSMPLGDFLGPKVVFWTDAEPTSVLSSSRILHLANEESGGKHYVKAIVTNPPFAVRVVTVPFGRDAMLRSQSDAPKRGDNDYSHLGSQGRFDDGETTLRIYTSENEIREFSAVHESMKQTGTTISSFSTYQSRDIKGLQMEFRYPPIPPINGFNIFGTVGDMRVGSALGNLLIGSRSFNLEAPATLDLKGLRKMDIKNGVMNIPLQIGYEDQPARIELRGTAEIYVNGESITRRIDNNKSLLDYAALTATVLGAVIALISTAIAIRDFTTK